MVSLDSIRADLWMVDSGDVAVCCRDIRNSFLGVFMHEQNSLRMLWQALESAASEADYNNRDSEILAIKDLRATWPSLPLRFCKLLIDGASARRRRNER